jgi:hypothetical protein
VRRSILRRVSLLFQNRPNGNDGLRIAAGNVLRRFGKYISLETAKTVILAVFPRGFEFVYGSEAGQRCTNSLANNIGKYTESQPPPTVLDCRHAHHEWWLKLDGNEHFWSPKGSCGVYHWGTWFELG